MSSGYSEEDIRRAAEIREWLIKEISDRQEEVERLRTTLSIIDNLLKQGSLRAAANLGFAEAATRLCLPKVELGWPASLGFLRSLEALSEGSAWRALSGPRPLLLAGTYPECGYGPYGHAAS